jgi:hypothetical protein
VSPLEAIKLFGMYRRLRKEGTTVNETTNKPGYKTTEFWMTVLVQIPAVLGIFLGATNPIVIGVGAAATIAYTLSRAWSKSNAGAIALAALKAAEEEAKKVQAEPKGTLGVAGK